MNSGLDISKYMKSINSDAAINAAKRDSITVKQDTSESAGTVEFSNRKSDDGDNTKFWVT